MRYFITGATGFIGSRLAQKILEREDSTVYFLVRERSLAKAEALRRRWGVGPERAVHVVGDLTLPRLGVSDADLGRLRGVEHMFHLGAVYDLRADAEAAQAANVEGTRHALEFAREAQAGCFHLVSSIAAAGLYKGVFREDMFEEAENLEHPYFGTKHESEAIVRGECRRPWRVYRPGIVVGDSRSGEMDKIDGPYYFFKLIQKLRHFLPEWMPAIGIEGGRLNLVPVDFVAAAMDHIAHQPGLDGRCFHLTDPKPRRVGDILNLFAKAGHAPSMSLKVNPRMLGFIPEQVRLGVTRMAPVRRVGEQLLKDLGLPPGVEQFVSYPTRFDSREAQAALAGTGIEVPPLEDYAWKLWDYWERHLDPELFRDRSLAGAVKGKVVLVTGGGQGIGRATVGKLAEAGATVIVVARNKERLRKTADEISQAGGRIATYACDLTDFEQVDRTAAAVLEAHGAVDVLINNAGVSIRRSIEHSFDRFRDFERTMRLNYFGALRLTLALLPAMQERKSGHVINISSIGVLTNAPRFSAYVASKSAMDAFARCAASEFADDDIAFTSVNMPLVRTAMSAATELYSHTTMLSPEEAADLVAQAVIERPERVTTRLGVFAEIVHAVAPKLAHIVMNAAYRMYPESAAALGIKDPAAAPKLTPEQIAFAELTRGMQF